MRHCQCQNKCVLKSSGYKWKRNTHMSVLEPASIHTEVETGGHPLDRQEADLERRTLKYRWGQTNRQS